MQIVTNSTAVTMFQRVYQHQPDVTQFPCDLAGKHIATNCRADARNINQQALCAMARVTAIAGVVTWSTCWLTDNADPSRFSGSRRICCQLNQLESWVRLFVTRGVTNFCWSNPLITIVKSLPQVRSLKILTYSGLQCLVR